MAKIVYLDQFVYSDWSKAELGRSSGAVRTTALGELAQMRRLFSAGKIVCPLSFAHAAEQSRWGDIEARNRATELMLEFADGLVLRHLNDALDDAAPLIGWAPSILPFGTVTPLVLESIDGMLPSEQLRFVFSILVENVALPASEFIDRTVGDFERGHERSLQPDPANTASRRKAVVQDLARLRVFDPGRRTDPGDPFDFLHTCFATLVDYGVVDKRHVAIARQSKYVLGRIVPSVSKLLGELGAYPVAALDPECPGT